jgi:hopene-associated glycosyltransferase HpnB
MGARAAPWGSPLMFEIIALIAFATWLYLLAARGGFWRARERDDRPDVPGPTVWPPVTAVIPARDEATTIARCLQSVLGQDYPGALQAVVVDDGSNDGTGTIAGEAAAEIGARDRLTVLQGQPLPPGWTGKVWAQKQGVDVALGQSRKPKYLLLTDADIVYAPPALRRLVSRAENGPTVLTSVMAKLNCESVAERCFIPAFVFFFQMLYPFAWVNRRDHATAAAAGGCMLVRADALTASGGIEGIRGALIDDCALAKQLKPAGPMWLGLSTRVQSIRRYDGLGPIRKMITRSAYAELRYSPLRLIATTLAMAVTFLAGPLLAVFGSGTTALLSLATWGAMFIAFQPTLRLYGLNPLWGFALPAIALVYMIWTIESALQYARGRGGAWKGRIQAAPRGAR